MSFKRRGKPASQHFDGLTANRPASSAATDERQESENAADSWTGPADGSDPVLDRILRRNQPRRSEWLGPLLVAVPILLVTAGLWFVTTRPPGRDLIWSIPPGSPLSSTAQTPFSSTASPPPDGSVSQAARATSARGPLSVAPPSELARVGKRTEKSSKAEDTTDDAAAEAEEPAEDAPIAAAPPTKITPAKSDFADRSSTVAKNPAEILNKPVGQNFNQNRIQEVVEYLTESTGVTFQLDMKSLWYDQGTTRNVPVTLEAEKMSVHDFLEEVVVKQLKAAYLVRDDKIVITSRKAANKSNADTP